MTFNTAIKIRGLYADSETIDRRAGDDARTQIAKIIWSGGFASAACRCGTCKGYTDLGLGLTAFRPNLKGNIYFVVWVTSNDMYSLDLVRVKRDRAEFIARSGEVFIDRLPGTYEGMYDLYINEYQNGWIHIGA